MSRTGWGGLEEVPDAAGEVAFEAADGFAGALAFGSFAVQVGAGLGVAAGAGDGDAVNGGVDLAVAAAVESVACGGARGAEAGLGEQLRRDRGDQAAISASEALIVCESSRMRRSASRAMRTRVVCSARGGRRATRGPQLP